MSDNGKRKNKVFLKKNNEKSTHQADDFYEYDKMKSKIDTVDEEFFEKLESIDYDKVKQDKESNKSNENIVEQENKNNIESEKQSQENIKKPLFDEKIEKDQQKTINNFDFTKPIETVKQENKDLNEDKVKDEEDDDDDFGSLDKDIEDDKKEENDKKAKEDSVFEKFDFVQSENQPLENSDNYDSLFYDDEDESEKPLEVTGVINKVNEQRQKIHSLDPIYNKDIDKDKDDDDDDDYGSLDDYTDDDENINDTNYRASNFVNINQKPNYYKEDDFDDEDEDDEECFVERKRKKKHRCKSFFKYLFLVLFALAAMGVYFGLTHDLFKIDYIKVSGNVINDKQTILEKSGVKVGDNIFLTRSSKIKKNLKQIPTIESVNVIKDYPNIISIEIKENYVSSYINTSAGIITIDNFGKVKNTSAENKDLTGIQLKGLKENKFRVGEPFSNDSKKVNLILELLTKPYYNTVSLIDFTDEKQIVFKLNDSIKVSFGSLDDYSKKLKVLDVLLKKIKTDGINASEIILDVGKNPIIVKK